MTAARGCGQRLDVSKHEMTNEQNVHDASDADPQHEPVAPFVFTPHRLRIMEETLAVKDEPCVNRDSSKNAKQSQLENKQSARASKYKGVNLHRRGNRWEAHIWHGKKQLHIGCFKSEMAAAVAFDIMAMKLKGSGTQLNFRPDFYEPEREVMEDMTNEQLHALVRMMARGSTEDPLKSSKPAQQASTPTSVPATPAAEPSPPPEDPQPKAQSPAPSPSLTQTLRPRPTKPKPAPAPPAPAAPQPPPTRAASETTLVLPRKARRTSNASSLKLGSPPSSLSTSNRSDIPPSSTPNTSTPLQSPSSHLSPRPSSRNYNHNAVIEILTKLVMPPSGEGGYDGAENPTPLEPYPFDIHSLDNNLENVDERQGMSSSNTNSDAFPAPEEEISPTWFPAPRSVSPSPSATSSCHAPTPNVVTTRNPSLANPAPLFLSKQNCPPKAPLQPPCVPNGAHRIHSHSPHPPQSLPSSRPPARLVGPVASPFIPPNPEAAPPHPQYHRPARESAASPPESPTAPLLPSPQLLDADMKEMLAALITPLESHEPQPEAAPPPVHNSMHRGEHPAKGVHGPGPARGWNMLNADSHYANNGGVEVLMSTASCESAIGRLWSGQLVDGLTDHHAFPSGVDIHAIREVEDPRMMLPLPEGVNAEGKAGDSNGNMGEQYGEPQPSLEIHHLHHTLQRMMTVEEVPQGWEGKEHDASHGLNNGGVYSASVYNTHSSHAVSTHSQGGSGRGHAAGWEARRQQEAHPAGQSRGSPGSVTTAVKVLRHEEFARACQQLRCGSAPTGSKKRFRADAMMADVHDEECQDISHQGPEPHMNYPQQQQQHRYPAPQPVHVQHIHGHTAPPPPPAPQRASQLLLALPVVPQPKRLSSGAGGMPHSGEDYSHHEARLHNHPNPGRFDPHRMGMEQQHDQQHANDPMVYPPRHLQPKYHPSVKPQDRRSRQLAPVPAEAYPGQEFPGHPVNGYFDHEAPVGAVDQSPPHYQPHYEGHSYEGSQYSWPADHVDHMEHDHVSGASGDLDHSSDYYQQDPYARLPGTAVQHYCGGMHRAPPSAMVTMAEAVSMAEAGLDLDVISQETDVQAAEQYSDEWVACDHQAMRGYTAGGSVGSQGMYSGDMYDDRDMYDGEEGPQLVPRGGCYEEEGPRLVAVMDPMPYGYGSFTMGRVH